MGKIYEPKLIRNVSLSGAPNVGKTSLSEALLFASGQIKEMGSVDRGTTVMDYDEEEISKKMSLHTSLAYTEWKNVKINLFDTPGIPDLAYEVRSTFRVSEGIVFVVSGVEGITIDTEKDWHFADDYHIARVVFINKMDEEGADFYEQAEVLKRKFKKPVIPIQIPIGSGTSFKGTIDLIHMKAYYPDGLKVKEGAIPEELQEKISKYQEMLFEAVAETDDTLIEKFLDGEPLTPEEVEKGLKSCTMNNKFIPVMCGSATQNIGTYFLLNTIISYLPSPLYIGEVTGIDPLRPGEIIKRHPDTGEPFSGFVFKTRIDAFAGKISYVRIRSGVVNLGDEIFNVNKDQKEKVSRLFMVDGKNFKEIEKLEAGDIAVMTKIESLGTGDTLTAVGKGLILEPIRLPKPSYFLAVHSKDRKSEDKLSDVFHNISMEDISFQYQYEEPTKEMILSFVGEVQAKIILGTVKHKFGLEFETRPPRVAYKETITKEVESQYKHKKQSGGHGQFADVYLKIEPQKRNGGFEFVEKIYGGAIPKQYLPGVEKGVQEACQVGPVAGYPVVDVRVTVFDGSFHPVDSSDMAFKIAASHAAREGFEKAGAVILEPIAKIKVFVGEDDIGNVMSDLSNKRGKVMGMEKISEDTTVINATAPYNEMLSYAPVLNSLTSGRGRFEMEFFEYSALPQTEYAKAIKQAEEIKAEEESKHS